MWSSLCRTRRSRRTASRTTPTISSSSPSRRAKSSSTLGLSTRCRAEGGYRLRGNRSSTSRRWTCTRLSRSLSLPLAPEPPPHSSHTCPALHTIPRPNPSPAHHAPTPRFCMPGMSPASRCPYASTTCSSLERSPSPPLTDRKNFDSGRPPTGRSRCCSCCRRGAARHSMRSSRITRMLHVAYNPRLAPGCFASEAVCGARISRQQSSCQGRGRRPRAHDP